jgi:hypothetical protein
MEAVLKLYNDSKCSGELATNSEGNYTISVFLIAASDYTAIKTIYIKNIGTHKAYNISVDIAGDITFEPVSLLHAELSVNDIMKCDILIPITKDITIKGNLNITINYDNIK